VTIAIITPFFPSVGALGYYHFYLFIKVLNPKYLTFVFAPKILT